MPGLLLLRLLISWNDFIYFSVIGLLGFEECVLFFYFLNLLCSFNTIVRRFFPFERPLQEEKEEAPDIEIKVVQAEDDRDYKDNFNSQSDFLDSCVTINMPTLSFGNS